MANHQLLPVPIATDQRVGIVRATDEVTVEPENGKMHIGDKAVKNRHLADGAVDSRVILDHSVKLLDLADDVINRFTNIEQSITNLRNDLTKVEDSLGENDGSFDGTAWEAISYLLKCCTKAKQDIQNIQQSITSINQSITSINGQITDIKNDYGHRISHLETVTANLIDGLKKYVYMLSVDPDGYCSFPSSIDNVVKIPIANLNVFSGTENPDNGTYANAIRSRALSVNDLKGM